MNAKRHTLEEGLVQGFPPKPIAQYVTAIPLKGVSDDVMLSSVFLEPYAAEGEFLKPLLKAWFAAADRKGVSTEEVASRLSSNLHLFGCEAGDVPLLREVLTGVAHQAGFYVPESVWRVHGGDFRSWVLSNPVDYILGRTPS